MKKSETTTIDDNQLILITVKEYKELIKFKQYYIDNIKDTKDTKDYKEQT